MPTYGVYRLDGRGYSDWFELQPVLDSYAQKLRKNIKISVPHCETSPVETDEDSLYIKIFSNPDDGYITRHTLQTAYGIRLRDSQDDAVKPGGNLLVVYDNDGVAVAQFTEGCVYVLFDLIHGPNCGSLMNMILDDYVLFLKDPKDFSALVYRRASEASFNNFCSIFLGELENQYDNLTGFINDLEEEIRELQKEIIQKNREREKFIRKRKISRALLEQRDEAKAVEVFETLKKYSDTGDILVDKSSITIPMGQIYIDYEGETYDIGVFDLIIYPNGDNGGVRCINKTRNVEGNFHPHVDSSGDCCLGNISDSVAQLVGTMEYEMVVVLMKQFLRSCNDDGWYQEVTSWPNVKGGIDDQSD